jgi:putative transposase
LKKRHTPEQIVRMLREADAELAAGVSVSEIARKLGISEATFHRWRNHYGGMKADATKRLKELEKENTRLKKIVAEQAVDISILKEVSRKKLLRLRPGRGLPSGTFGGTLGSPSVGRARRSASPGPPSATWAVRRPSGDSPSFSVQHKRAAVSLVSYNAGHVLIEEALHDAIAQSSRPPTRERRH